MAVAIDASGGAFDGSSGSTATLTGSITVGSLTNGIMVVGFNQNAGNITRVQLDNSSGVDFTQLSTAVTQSSTRSSDIWYLKNPSAGSHTVYITATGIVCAAILTSWSGVDQTSPFGTRNTSTAQAPNENVTTPVGSVVIDFFGEQFNDNVPTRDASQTDILTGYGVAQGVQMISASYKARTGATTNMQWTGSADGAYQAVPLLVAASAVKPAPQQLFQTRTL